MDIQPTQRVAVRAAIVRDGKVLVIRESPGYEGGSQHGFYDLPGGKLELGESIVDAINREVHEEVGLEVEINEPFCVDEWRPTVKGEMLQIIGIFFVCTPRTTSVLLSNDHDDFKWIGKDDLTSLPLTDPVPGALQVLINKDLIT